MKLTRFAILLTLAFTFACKKDNKVEEKKYEVTSTTDGDLVKSPTTGSLTGNWRLTSQRIGDGGIGEWLEVTDYKVITFTDGGSFVNTDGTVNRFSIAPQQGDTIISMTYKPSSGNTTTTVWLKVYDNAVYLYGLNCTEGCTFKYNRAN